ncbi:hypothetical protein ACFT0G_35740 [Streptomyces sp. NPDC057020]|uniref:hypothetical protein n=1 Tax=unclassified Streptomyces TaxID=2593676 RepID=UPI00363FF517
MFELVVTAVAVGAGIVGVSFLIHADSVAEFLAIFVGVPVALSFPIGWWSAGREARAEQQRLREDRAALTDAEQRVVSSLSPGGSSPEAARGDQETDGGQGSSSASGPSSLTLAALWDTTHIRLKLYHDVALGQANRSFRSAHAAMWLGFLTLGLFVAVAFRASTTAGSIVAGGLGAVSAGLAGFIGRTFVRSQENAAEHLRSYFDQPLEMARYLAAERLIADARLSDEQRAEVLASIVTAMVAGPQPQADQQAPTAVLPQQTAGR